MLLRLPAVVLCIFMSNLDMCRQDKSETAGHVAYTVSEEIPRHTEVVPVGEPVIEGAEQIVTYVSNSEQPLTGINSGVAYVDISFQERENVIINQPVHYVTGVVFNDTDTSFCGQKESYSSLVSGRSNIPCGSTRDNPCYAAAAGAMTHDCKEGCLYKVNLTFPDIYDVYDEVYSMNDIYIRIFKRLEPRGEMQGKVTLAIEPRLFLNCEYLCVLQVDGGEEKRRCLSEANLSKCVLSSEHRNSKVTRHRARLTDSCVLSSSEDLPNYECPKLLELTYNKLIKAVISKEGCSNTFKFVDTEENEQMCGQSVDHYCSVKFSFRGIDNRKHKTNLIIGNVDSKEQRMEIYYRGVNYFNESSLHPNVEISKKALESWTRGKHICEKDKSYYIINRGHTRCDAGYKKVRFNVDKLLPLLPEILVESL